MFFYDINFLSLARTMRHPTSCHWSRPSSYIHTTYCTRVHSYKFSCADVLIFSYKTKRSTWFVSPHFWYHHHRFHSSVWFQWELHGWLPLFDPSITFEKERSRKATILLTLWAERLEINGDQCRNLTMNLRRESFPSRHPCCCCPWSPFYWFHSSRGNFNWIWQVQF